ncbi:hypothetical protein ACH5RR_022097 [Cinchona calisaya]|uniref:Uncharacterized protein n=1 Tax=Cinchona calisaya TaxID=153742 RepID=A0ABD2Z6V9_9GENT
MEAGTGSATANNRLSKALVTENDANKLVKSSRRAMLSKGRKKAKIIEDESFNKNSDRMRISRSNSENEPIDNTVREYGFESSVVAPNIPLPTDPVILVGHEEGKNGQFNDQEGFENFKAQVKELRKEVHRLSQKLKDESAIAVQLRDENRILLDELKLKLKGRPDIINFLEAQDPDRST